MAQLSKSNARDVAKARALLRQDGGRRYYAATLSGIHRSSSLSQHEPVEDVFGGTMVSDGMFLATMLAEGRVF